MEQLDVARLGWITLADIDDRQVRLGDLWSDHPAVLLLLRHFG